LKTSVGLSGVFGRRVVVDGRDVSYGVDDLDTEALGGLSAKAETIVPVDKRDDRRRLFCACSSCIPGVCEEG